MTNKRLIRYCNIYWEMGKTCSGCKYCMNYCTEFHRKTGLPTPFRENRFHPEVYTDEEWEVVTEKEIKIRIRELEKIMSYVKQNTFLGSLTIKEMNELQQKLRVWYNEQDDEDEWYEVDDDYASNCPCDTYGMCAGPSCSQYFSCHSK